MNTAPQLDINDYLDLYLFAEHIGDPLWQDEILKKLHHLSNKSSFNHQALDKVTLWDQYKYINEEILNLYQQLRNHPAKDDLQEIIWRLKQQRLLLGRQLGLVKGDSFKK